MRKENFNSKINEINSNEKVVSTKKMHGEKNERQ